MNVRSQTDIRLEEIPLIQEDPEALEALRILHAKGYTTDQVKQAFEELQPVPVTKARQRQAKRATLDMRIKTEAAKILHERSINPEGRDLDRKRLGRSNLIVMKAVIDQLVNAVAERKSGERSEFTRSQLDQIDVRFDEILVSAVEEVFGGH